MYLDEYIQVTKHFHPSHSESLFLDVVKQNSLFFYLDFLSQIFTIHRTAGKWEAISLYPFCNFHSLHRHLDISQVIAAESSPLCKAGSRTGSGNLALSVWLVPWYVLSTTKCYFYGTFEVCIGLCNSHYCYCYFRISTR